MKIISVLLKRKLEEVTKTRIIDHFPQLDRTKSSSIKFIRQIIN